MKIINSHSSVSLIKSHEKYSAKDTVLDTENCTWYLSIKNADSVQNIKFSDFFASKIYISQSLCDFDFSYHFDDFAYGLVKLLYSIELPCVSEVKPLLSSFYLDYPVTKLNNNFYVANAVFKTIFKFSFVSHCFTIEGFVLSSVMLLFKNKVFQVLLLCILVYLMQSISTIVCAHRKSGFFASIQSMIIHKKTGETCQHYTSYSLWFINTYNHIVGLSNWVYEYIYNYLNPNRLYESIMLKIYNNVKGLMVKFSINYNIVMNRFIHLNKTVHVLSILNIMSFAGGNLYAIYAVLTVIYVLVGWLLDYLSYIWILSSNSLKYKYIFTVGFWYKRLIYAIIYITWLYTGVISTNGIYFSIFGLGTSVNNLITAIVGSIMCYITSNLWYLHGNTTLPERLNLSRLIKNVIILPLILRNNNRNVWNMLKEVLSGLFYWVFTPASFNYLSSFKRSLLEWLSFLGMVLSSYGTWNIYMTNVFYRLSVLQNFLIWTSPSFIAGFVLIYLEEMRPIFSHYYYGIVYLIFWTSICFSTNTILVGYININNALTFLIYFLPINFVLAFTYSIPLYRYNLNLGRVNRVLPLYRYNLNLGIVNRVLHLFLFILLTGVTLLSIGTLWYILSPV